MKPWGSTTMSEDYHRYLDPIDDLPPSTIITHYEWIDSQHVRIRGTASDSGTIDELLVNGKPDSPIEENYPQWEIVVSAPSSSFEFDVEAISLDAKGNREQLPHWVRVRPNRY